MGCHGNGAALVSHLILAALATTYATPSPQNSSTIRLVGGENGTVGRVEVAVNGTWGTVCDDNWDWQDARVACRSLGFARASEVFYQAHFGPGNGSIFLDDVDCAGFEVSLFDCAHPGLGIHNCEHAEDAGVRCSSVPETVTPIRLVDGGKSSEGRVELLFGQTWGNICDDSWDLQDANVVCRSLGFPSAREATLTSTFGGGTGVIWLDEVQCVGNETSVLECPANDIGDHDCTHIEDAGVRCLEVRLVDGARSSEGRVEVFYDGEWGTVCDDSWDMQDADVVCRSLGFPSALKATVTSTFGGGTGVIWLDEVQCVGNETSVLECPANDLGDHDCTHIEDAGVRCLEVRLVDGARSSEGRVEVFYDGRWGTVCDDSWDMQDADVVCRSLGFSSALEATATSTFGGGTGAIWLDEVQCVGDETTVLECPANDLGNHNCAHSEDVGVRCLDDDNRSTVRLVGGSTSGEGRAEVFLDGRWGTVCSNGWEVVDAQVLCRYLGFPGVEIIPPAATYEEGTGDVIMGDVECIGNETHLFDCRYSGFGAHGCNHSQDVSVQCSRNGRLAGGHTQMEGRVELYHSGAWGTVCDDNWGLQEAHVFCRSLGFWTATEASQGATYGEGTGEILLDEVDCLGSETSLMQCSHIGIGGHDCEHSEDAGVRCQPFEEACTTSLCPTPEPNDGDHCITLDRACVENVPDDLARTIRLVDGTRSSDGRVELFVSGRWGSICDDSWDLQDADVVCRSLGFPSALEVTTFGGGTGVIWLDEVQCVGNETSVLECPANDLGDHDCTHVEDAGVRCLEEFSEDTSWSYFQNWTIKCIMPLTCPVLRFDRHTLNYENKSITSIEPGAFHSFPSLQRLYLAYNKIHTLEALAFEGLGNLDILYIRTCEIYDIAANAFLGLTLLRDLDLKENSLTVLRTDTFNGLDSLYGLDLRFNQIHTVESCGFCGLHGLFVLNMSFNAVGYLNADVFQGLSSLEYFDLSYNHIQRIDGGAFQNLFGLRIFFLVESELGLLYPETLHGLTSLEALSTSDSRLCCLLLNGNITQASDPQCIRTYQPSLLETCGSIYPSIALRVLGWIMGLTALLGNTAVLVARYRMRNAANTSKVQNYMIMSLAMADCLMGVYMIIVTSADMYYGQEYYISAPQWRQSGMCLFAGFLGFLSSEASVFTLTLITIDRFICIVFPFSGRKIGTKTSIKIIGCMWLFIFVLSLVPILTMSTHPDVYGLSDVCLGLPLHVVAGSEGWLNVTSSDHFSLFEVTYVMTDNSTRPPWWFSIVIFIGVNLTSFVFILVCYITMLVKVVQSSKAVRHSSDTRREVRVAVKMAMIIATDFVCWIPVIVMGILVQTGAVVLDSSIYAWTVILIVPINSSINPFIYTFILYLEKGKAKENGKNEKSHSTELETKVRLQE